MHELAATEHLLALALEHAEAAGARRITAINVVAGDLSGVLDDAMQLYVDLLSRGTRAEGTRLHVRRVPATLRCQACASRHVALLPLYGVCPACGSPRLELEGGRELYVESIEVDDEAGPDTTDL
jgi:hydrogenase nickel incorporation protein HypA/HybF